MLPWSPRRGSHLSLSYADLLSRPLADKKWAILQSLEICQALTEALLKGLIR